MSYSFTNKKCLTCSYWSGIREVPGQTPLSGDIKEKKRNKRKLNAQLKDVKFIFANHN